jgi:hypothetical protein
MKRKGKIEANPNISKKYKNKTKVNFFVNLKEKKSSRD